MELKALYSRLGLDRTPLDKGPLDIRTPIDGSIIARVKTIRLQEVNKAVERSSNCFKEWRMVPAPKRGELIRLFSQELREIKEPLGELVSLESGKIREEGEGEVQEMIDICDFAVGLSRQLYGLTMASERPRHRMAETWHPIGPIGVISSFNFPVAVWSWNFALAIVCGNPVLWKPSEKTPISALACQAAFDRVVAKLKEAPLHLSQVLVGTGKTGQQLVDNPSIPLISATGSCAMGRSVAARAARRLGRCLLELGGNNAMIISSSADLSLATRAIVFSAIGTAGQRCTTLRRLIIHQKVYANLIAELKKAYRTIRIGSPLEKQNIMGPLIDKASYENMQNAMKQAKCEGGKIFGGGRILENIYPNAYYVKPAIIEMPSQTPIVKEETFAPILYAMKYRKLDQAIEIQNSVTQGLSSCIFSNDLNEAEHFLSSDGSDCGIANVNIGPSGAEIGGAFGGEKATGGGREAGSDAWKSYMRRSTNTINYSNSLPLAQGIRFDI